MDAFVRTLKKRGKPRVWIHPVLGEPKFPMGDEPMPLRYKQQGYEERVFESYFEHKQWCKSKGLVNHALEGIKDEDDAQLSRWGY